MADSLVMKFLGPPEVFLEKQKVKFATRKTLALFIYLVVETGMHPREKLQAIFWPESENHLAQSALRNTLVRIKRGLREVDSFLQVDGNLLGFNPGCVSKLDLELVKKATTEIQSSQLNSTTIALLQKAVEVMRGPFLEAFSLPDTPTFDDWIMSQRTAWDQRSTIIHDRLSIHQLETRLIQPAIETINHWLIWDPLNESAYCRLMRLQFLDGNRSAALQTYETCRRLLDNDLGLEPSLELKEMFAHIQSSTTPLNNSQDKTQAHPLLRFPYVGRMNEHKTLVDTFFQVKDGNPQVLIVSGASGTGKTRLAGEFLRWVDTEGADILCGNAYKTGGYLPYQPVIDAFRERLELENAPEDLLDDVWLTELTTILPELRERYPDLPTSSCDALTAKSRLFEAVARLGQSFAARKPLVLLIDNLQWVDSNTLELIHYLVYNWQTSSSPVLLLMLVRSEAIVHGSDLHDWVRGLSRGAHFTHLTIEGTPDSDPLQLVQSLVGENIEGTVELTAWLNAGGNNQPLFVTEILKALDDQGILAWVDGRLNTTVTLNNLQSIESSSLSDILQDFILSRLEWLSQQAYDMLVAAVVIGHNCSFLLLCQVSGTDERTGLNAIEELLSSQLILETQDKERPYTISHSQIQELVCNKLSSARKKVFHQRFMTAISSGRGSS